MMASTPLSPRLECGGRGIPLRIGLALVPIFDRAHFHEVSGLDLYGAATVCQVIELFIKHTVLVPAAPIGLSKLMTGLLPSVSSTS